MSRSQDLACLLKAVQMIAEAGVSLQQRNCQIFWQNSSFRTILEEGCRNSNASIKNFSIPNVSEVAKNLQDGLERASTVAENIKVYTELQTGKYNTNTPVSHREPTTVSSAKVEVRDRLENKPSLQFVIKLTESDKRLLKKLDMEHRAKLLKQAELEKDYQKEMAANVVKEPEKRVEDDGILTEIPTSVPNPKSKLKLSENSKQRKVPSSRIGRMVSFGTLAAGLGLGTAAEYAKRLFTDNSNESANLFMSKANLDRIVDTLCKVRGAALKLGQIMSIQDESVVNPELAKALERVRKSADFMPDWQVEEMMCGELGADWKQNFVEWEEKPFAAASIGQVHVGRLKSGEEVAVKIQYPGVAKGINSDIDNLGGIMKMWNIFPKGMFLENLMTVAKRELAWEVDYVREAECTKKFKNILKDYKDYYVPNVIDDLSTKQVFTTELLDGVPIDQCFDLPYEDRFFIGDKIMNLCLLEILEFKYMQTDPNWANFLYNAEKKQLLLLDFGASREYSKEFMDKYVKILKAACDGDKNTVLEVSKELGFLTGYESKVMEEAHVDAVMILGEIFREDGPYDFAHQDMTYRIQNLAQIMLVHRLCPPPEEVYSLHRKLSGVFLLLGKLKVAINCREKFLKLYNNYISQQN